MNSIYAWITPRIKIMTGDSNIDHDANAQALFDWLYTSVSDGTVKKLEEMFRARKLWTSLPKLKSEQEEYLEWQLQVRSDING